MDDERTGLRYAEPVDSPQALLRDVADDPWGDVAPSVYDTARLVSLAPWLAGDAERVGYLFRRQHRDGSWGAPDGYGLVPTLSATEALLAWLRRPPVADVGVDRARIHAAAGLAVRALRRWLDGGTPLTVPDTIAVELVVPELVAQINRHLADGAGEPPLALPAGLDPGVSAAVRSRLTHGASVPQTWWASLEAFGVAAIRLPGVYPVGGAVACAPAATAAWLGHTPHVGDPAVHYLTRLQARGGGPVPAVTPITTFERAWVLCGLAAGRSVPASLVDSLDAALADRGAPAAPGLPPDCDDSAVVLSALARHGRRPRVDWLDHYRGDGYFVCFPGERTPSVSTNAHVLEAIGRCTPVQRRRLEAAAAMVTRWLIDNQHTDGGWIDKWHASRYYATACCVQALACDVQALACDAQALADRPTASALQAIRRAAGWVLATQRSDGSWGRWTGSVEETAYGIQVLTSMPAPVRDDAVARAVTRAAAYLAATPVTPEHPALWHAKDLYAPLRVIRAARLGALAAARTTLARSASASSRPGGEVEASRIPAQRPGPDRSAATRPASVGTG
jgi:hypothetical protein